MFELSNCFEVKGIGFNIEALVTSINASLGLFQLTASGPV